MEPTNRKQPRLNSANRIMKEAARHGREVVAIIAHADGRTEYRLAGSGAEPTTKTDEPSEWDRT